MTDSNFTIGFIGLGLIGGSIAKGIRRVFPNYTLIGMDENPDTIKSALEDGIIDSIATDCKTDFAECNYVFLCAPVQYNVMYLKDLKGSINENCILTDVGSVKEEIHLKIEELGMEGSTDTRYRKILYRRTSDGRIREGRFFFQF